MDYMLKISTSTQTCISIFRINIVLLAKILISWALVDSHSSAVLL